MKNKSKRIAYISLMSGFPWGGSEAYWSAQAFNNLDKGNTIFVSVYDWGKDTHSKIEKLQAQGAKVQLRERFSHDVSLAKKVKRFVQNRFSSLNNKWDELIRFKPDEIFISQGDNFDLTVHHYDLYLQLYKHNLKYSFICHSHRQYSTLPDANIYPRGKDVFNNADTVYFVSYRQWNLAERQLCMKFTNAKFTFNPLNLEENRILAYPNTTIAQMAIVGALVSGKGQDTLFEVLSQPHWKQRNWQLNIYGKGYGLAYLQELARYFNIEDKVIFHGHVGSATEIWEQNQILLIPSDGEGLPISLIEAAISGRTAVVTDVGGNTEIISDNVNGFVACAPTPHSFSEALDRAWKRKNEWNKLGLQLRDDVDQKRGAKNKN